MFSGALASPALAANCTWNPATGNWSTASDWSCGIVPTGGPDTANIAGGKVVTVNTAQSILNLNNAGGVNIDASSLTLANGGTTTNTGGVINVANGSALNQFGSTIVGGTINTTGTGKLVASNNNNNFLSGVTLNGTLDMTATGIERVTGGLTLNGAVNINNNSLLSFIGDQTLGGTGTVALGNTGASNRALMMQGDTALTIGSNIVVRGENGTIGQAYLAGGTQSLINNGRIAADVSGGSISLAPSHGITNNGVLEAQNGGTLVLNSNVTGNVGSSIVAGAGSTVLQNGVALSGVINTTGDGAFRAANNNNNFLNGVAFNGTLDMATATSIERVTGGLTLNGAVNINNNSVLSFAGDQTLGGTGTVVLGNTGASNRALSMQGHTVLTIGSDIVVRGEDGTIGQAYLAGGTQSLINNGRIAADVSGGSISLEPSHGITNNGVLEAQNGGTLVLNSNVVGTPTGSIVAGAGSTVLQNAVTLSGVINSAGTGNFRVANSNSNFLDGVTFNGPLDLASATSVERVVNGLTLNGTINVNNNSVLSFNGDQTLGGNGTIVLGNTGASNRALGLEGNTVLTVGSGVTVRGENGTVGQAYLSGGVQQITNNGSILADVGGGTVALATGLTLNNALLGAANGGTLRLDGTVTQAGAGQINAANGSTVIQNGVTITGGAINTAGTGRHVASNSNSNVLSGVTLGGQLDMASATGVERVTNGLTLNGGTVNVNNNSVLSFNGDQTLGGTGSIVLGNTGASNRALGLEGNTTLTIASGVTVRGINGTVGQAYIAGGTQNIINNGTINSDGGGLITVTPAAIVNNGLMRAQNGTLTNQAVLSGTGTLQVDATGVMNLANGAKTQGQLVMGAAGAALNLGTGNLTINTDYTNTAAGSGNAFNRRAGVAGAGLIVAGGDVAQAITGAGVTNGNTANATLTIGNVHVGANNFAYQVANTGTTGPSLRGAIQTNVNGASLTDARLSGAGVTASNYNTGAPGGNTGNLGVTFTAANAGALAPLNGQVLNLRSNFENIADQKLNIVLGGGAAAYNIAAGNAMPTPVVLANQRVGGAGSQTLTVSNTAPAGAFTEGLNASFGANSGNATNNAGGISLLAGGASNGAAMSVGVDTSSAGARSGTVTLNYVSDGTGTSGLGLTNVGSQVINVSGNVYRLAQGAATPTPVNFGNRHVGDVVSQALTVQNTSAADGFSERLNASFGANAGHATNNGGGIGLLGAGGSDNSAMSVGLDTSSAGAKNGSVTLNYASDGSGTSGLAAIAAGSQSINVSGNVYRLAQANNLGAINFGNVHVGDSVQQALSISNLAASDGFSEKLNASFGAGSDARITVSGGINQLAAGASDNSSMIVGLNTGAAGTVNGTQTINFASDGTGTSGLGITALASQTIGVSGDITTNGNVFRLASASPAAPNPVNFGNVRVGAVTDQALTISNTAIDDGFSEKLNASISSNGAPVTASGGFNLLGPQATDNTSLHVGIDTSSAGAKNGSASIALVSDGQGTSDLGQTNLPGQTVNVSGNVYRLANPLLNTGNVDLVARRGDAAPTAALSISNQSPDIFTEGLKANIASTPAGFSASGGIANLVAGGTDNASLQVALNTGAAGNFVGTAQVDFQSTGAGTTGEADVSAGSAMVNLVGKVYEAAVAQVNTVLVDFGIVHKGDVVAAKNISVTNAAPVAGLNDTLVGQFVNMPNGPFSGSGSVNGLGAGQTDAASLMVGLDTANAGVFSASGNNLGFASHNPDMADLILSDESVELKAQVNNYADADLDKTSGSGSFNENGNVYTLDFGNVTLGSSVSALLAVLNDVAGPADLLDGLFTFLDAQDFTYAGFGAFVDLDAGESQGGLSVAFNATALGMFSDDILLASMGHNASGYSGGLDDITLRIRGNVVQGGGSVPEPGTLALLGIALAGLMLARRRVTPN